MKKTYDCYNSNGQYLGVFFAENYEELAVKYPKVCYVAGDNAILTRKSWSELKIEDLDYIKKDPDKEAEEYISDNIIESNISKDNEKTEEKFANQSTIKEKGFSFKEISKDSQSNINELNHELEISENLWLFIKDQIKEKESQKRTLLQEVRTLRKEIKELQQQLERI